MIGTSFNFSLKAQMQAQLEDIWVITAEDGSVVVGVRIVVNDNVVSAQGDIPP